MYASRSGGAGLEFQCRCRTRRRGSVPGQPTTGGACSPGAYPPCSKSPPCRALSAPADAAPAPCRAASTLPTRQSSRCEERCGFLVKFFTSAKPAKTRTSQTSSSSLTAPLPGCCGAMPSSRTQVGPPAQRTHRQVQDAPAFAIVEAAVAELETVESSQCPLHSLNIGQARLHDLKIIRRAPRISGGGAITPSSLAAQRRPRPARRPPAAATPAAPSRKARSSLLRARRRTRPRSSRRPCGPSS